MKTYLAATALGLTFAAGGAWMLTRPGDAPLGATSIPGAAMAQDAAGDAPAAEVDTSSIVDMVQGSEDAPVEMIEYASFTCPHCADFSENQYQQLKTDYIDTGLVRFTMREVYFDRFGLWASMVARCGGEMRFFGIAEELYASQRDWIAGGQDPAAIAENLRTIGVQSGLDGEAVDACLSDGDQAATLVAWFQENAAADEVNSTPTLIIDGEKYSNMAYDDLADIIDARLEEAGVEPPAR
ncbi:DsbA family protein [Wenxinia saemankumensis]|uniref:Protein-disulfide isomerase n=1 Tax=Wenxinia saemankumensis TaxID=1447782 RepID=A0A1M6E2X1_9RHOB|nr:DsbA family protein [Wenxinia saemankumensis]SHI79791.1 Protein-disulfide isomerase [Wenxinia saemankumensis]